MDNQVKRILFSIVLISAILLSGEPITILGVEENFNAGPNGLVKVGDYPYPTNPMNDRAKGYLIQGKVKSAVFNYGNFVQWGDYTSNGYSGHPAGLWGMYTYLPHVSFTSGVAGKDYASNYEWNDNCIDVGNNVEVWCSEDAYYAWYEDGDTNFVTILFEDIGERGEVGNKIDDIGLITEKINGVSQILVKYSSAWKMALIQIIPMHMAIQTRKWESDLCTLGHIDQVLI